MGCGTSSGSSDSSARSQKTAPAPAQQSETAATGKEEAVGAASSTVVDAETSAPATASPQAEVPGSSEERNDTAAQENKAAEGTTESQAAGEAKQEAPRGEKVKAPLDSQPSLQGMARTKSNPSAPEAKQAAPQVARVVKDTQGEEKVKVPLDSQPSLQGMTRTKSNPDKPKNLSLGGMTRTKSNPGRSLILAADGSERKCPLLEKEEKEKEEKESDESQKPAPQVDSAATAAAKNITGESSGDNAKGEPSEDAPLSSSDEDVQQWVEEHLNRNDIEDEYEEYPDEDECRIGEGRYGRVWQGKSRTGDVFAIKTISPQGVFSTTFREIAVMLRNKHPNLLTIHEIFEEEDGTMHLVMPLVKRPQQQLDHIKAQGQSGDEYGADLYTWFFCFGVLTSEEVSKLLYQTASAIKYLNEHEIGCCIHRDLKPENILIGEKGFDQCLVTDYGLASITPQGEELLAKTCGHGSPGYTAPECMPDETHIAYASDGRPMAPYGKECDIFSLGCVAYISLSRMYPFGYDEGHRDKRAINGDYDPMEGKVWDVVDPAIRSLLTRMLKVDPSQRPTPDDIMADPYVAKHGAPRQP